MNDALDSNALVGIEKELKQNYFLKDVKGSKDRTVILSVLSTFQDDVFPGLIGIVPPAANEAYKHQILLTGGQIKICDVLVSIIKSHQMKEKKPLDKNNCNIRTVYAMGALQGQTSFLLDLLLKNDIVRIRSNSSLSWTSPDVCVVQLGNQLTLRGFTFENDSVTNDKPNTDMLILTDYLADISRGRFMSVVGADEYEFATKHSSPTKYVDMVRARPFQIILGKVEFSYVGGNGLSWKSAEKDVLSTFARLNATKAQHHPTTALKVVNGTTRNLPKVLQVDDTVYVDTLCPNSMSCAKLTFDKANDAKELKWHGQETMEYLNFTECTLL
jgi:hypothetical protein